MAESRETRAVQLELPKPSHLEAGARITVVAEKAGPVKSSAGPGGFAAAFIAGSSGFHVLLIPGGIGTRKEMAIMVKGGEVRGRTS